MTKDATRICPCGCGKTLGLYRGQRRYDVHFELLAATIDAPRARRREAIHGYLQQYVARLEHYCRIAPYNWFNFYDYWQPL